MRASRNALLSASSVHAVKASSNWSTASTDRFGVREAAIASIAGRRASGVERPTTRAPRERRERVIPGSHHRVGPAIAAGEWRPTEGVQEAGPHQRRLPAPRRPDQRQEASAHETPDRFGNDLFASEVELRVRCLETRESLVGAHVGRGSVARVPARTRRSRALVLGEDRRLQPLQFGAGFDPELIHQHGPSASEGLQRLRLTSGPVQGEHQLSPSPLAERLLPDHRFQVRRSRCRLAGGEPRVDPILEGGSPKLFEPLALGGSETRVPVVLVRALATVRALLERWTPASWGVLHRGVAVPPRPAVRIGWRRSRRAATSSRYPSPRVSIDFAR